MRRRLSLLAIAAIALSSCADGASRADRSSAAVPAGAKNSSQRTLAKASPELDQFDANADDLNHGFAQHQRSEKTLVGLDERGATELFGAPRVRHENATKKTWYYRDGSCALSLYFYLDMSSRVFRTLAYEVSSDDQSAESRDQCIARLQSAKQSAGSGDRQFDR
ncbi:MAG TPA: hypothetical protein VMV26_14970 [Alphaproteobacteria bacterium]|jgi:hypothetical protein|nr:hypothetical protein [Alphaproteobacteria bacterium]